MKGPSNSSLDNSPTRYTTDIIVFCFILEEVPAIENHFVVDITDKIKNILHLQNAIKEVKKPQLNDFALNDLKL
ncbi:17728_t:CDS:2 [Funneliformis caledonium]|uniref:17728_t:CDS:1 n=1 Tax=Funneliformis caledonium TaxID=1117310 RepID=A0A9N9DUJ0_9GLOM|nr:17728_t:CDS:2 [Funneliformis caledonium]